MLESQLINKVHKLLPSRTFFLKMRHPSFRGVPDCYYEVANPNRVVWVEYKVYPNKVTPLQLAWITHAKKRGIVQAYVATWRDEETLIFVEDKKLTLVDFVQCYLT